MSRLRANSSPELLPASLDTNQHVDLSLEGVAATVKLLLKLVQDHKESCAKEKNDSRRMLRVAGMMTVLESVKTRIQTSQFLGKKGEKAELRRCKTDLEKKPTTEQIDEKEKLRRELNASLAARKSLECVCSSLGKEKEIMAAELARKAHELNAMEELVSDLKARNEFLLGKVQEYFASNQHKEKKASNCFGGESSSNIAAALQQRNKELTEKLLRSLEGYKSKNRKLKEAVQEKATIHATMKEMGVEIGTGLERIRGFKILMLTAGKGSCDEQQVEIEEEILELEHMFEGFQMKLNKHGQKMECVKPKGEISACKPSSILA